MDAFDGAGREYRQPGFKTILLLGLVIVALIVGVWVAGAWLMAVPEASPAP
jgi:hypothetical protein